MNTTANTMETTGTAGAEKFDAVLVSELAEPFARLRTLIRACDAIRKGCSSIEAVTDDGPVQFSPDADDGDAFDFDALRNALVNTVACEIHGRLWRLKRRLRDALSADEDDARSIA